MCNSAATGKDSAIPIATIGRVTLSMDCAGGVVYWTSGLEIDADGSPRAYHPNSALGLDWLANAGSDGHWYGIATANGLSSGQPIIQGVDDPAPGFYVSTTSLYDPSRAWDDPRRYVDAEAIPYIVLPQGPRGGAAVGDFALVINQTNGKQVGAIAADIGPRNEIGEGSIALADALGIPSDPRIGGATGGILTIVFPGSRTSPAWPHTPTEINARVAGLLTQYQLDPTHLSV